MQVPTLLSFLSVVALASADSFSAEDQAIWIDRHNYFRTTGLPWSAGNMRRIGWDADLATTAASTASKCSASTAAGVNVYQSSSSNSSDILDEAIQQWVVETSMSTLASLTQPSASGQDVGTGTYNSYSQVLWATTTSVGCATASCSGGEMVVCQYSPAGNDGSSGWYVHANTASDCPSGTTASEGLCIVDGSAANDQIAAIPAGELTYEVYPAYVADMQTVLIEAARAIANGSAGTTSSTGSTGSTTTTAPSTGSTTTTAPTSTTAAPSTTTATPTATTAAPTSTSSKTSSSHDATSDSTSSSTSSKQTTSSSTGSATKKSSTTSSTETDSSTKQSSQTTSSSDESAPGTVKASSDSGSTFTNQVTSSSSESTTSQTSTTSGSTTTASAPSTGSATAESQTPTSTTTSAGSSSSAAISANNGDASSSASSGISAAGMAGMVVLAVVLIAAVGVVMSYRKNQQRQREIMRDGGIRII